jgi:competence protein ComFC
MLCARCRAAIRVLRGPSCGRCGAPTAWPVARCRECGGRRIAFTSARAAVSYEGPTRRLVHAWKERGLRRAAPLAADLVSLQIEPSPADLITYIPPDRDRQLRRGVHPAEQLAAELAARWGLDQARLLDRVRARPRQAELSRSERARNVRGAFAARRRAPETVILVDDVYTTGATSSSAAAILKSAGARTVHVVTFARTVR